MYCPECEQHSLKSTKDLLMFLLASITKSNAGFLDSSALTINWLFIIEHLQSVISSSDKSINRIELSLCTF